MMNHVKEGNSRNKTVCLWFILLSLPFFLNDFANIYVKDWHVWLAIDYVAVKLFPVIVLMTLVRKKILDPGEIGWTVQKPSAFLLTLLVCAYTGTVLDQNLGGVILSNIFKTPPLGGMPAITNPFFNWFDLTAGLLFVGVCEELVFRGMALRVLSVYTRNPVIIVLVSSVIFGLVHWSTGMANLLNAAVIGAVFMAVYLRTRSLPAIMLAHFFVDFTCYAGVIPLKLFKYLGSH